MKIFTLNPDLNFTNSKILKHIIDILLHQFDNYDQNKTLSIILNQLLLIVLFLHLHQEYDCTFEIIIHFYNF